MNKRTFTKTVYVADYTNYNQAQTDNPAPYKGVAITTIPSMIIPYFTLYNRNKVNFDAINIECNPGLLKHPNGLPASQCECLFQAVRNDHGKPWFMLLEIKYCMPKNIMNNVQDAIRQLKKTYKFLSEDKAFIERGEVKPYFVISTPDCESMSPFDSHYLDQDELLSIKEEFDGAQVYHTNNLEILTTRHLRTL